MLFLARFFVFLGSIALIIAPVFPYTVVPINSLDIPLRGLYLSGIATSALALILLFLTLKGKSVVLGIWMLIACEGWFIWNDMSVCLQDVGVNLGRVQLALSDVNNLIIKVGLSPVHIVDSYRISHMPIGNGLYLAWIGLGMSLLGSILWVISLGKLALWKEIERCKCGQRLRDNFKFCPNCGLSLSTRGKRCSRCGIKVDTFAKFCCECGNENNC